MNVLQMEEKAAQLRGLGMTKAADDLDAKAQLTKKLAVAYEHFRYVSQEKIDSFIARLRASTSRIPTREEYNTAASGFGLSRYEEAIKYGYASKVYDTLVLDALEKYDGVPPQDVLEKLAAAKQFGIFDTFEVAHVEPVATKVHFPDPILFGRVAGCTDHFFIGEWGNDVKLADLIGPNEG